MKPRNLVAMAHVESVARSIFAAILLLTAGCTAGTAEPPQTAPPSAEPRVQLMVFPLDGHVLWPRRPVDFEAAMAGIEPMAEERALLKISEAAVDSYRLDRRSVELTLNDDGRRLLLAAGVPLDGEGPAALQWFERKGFLLVVDGERLLAGEGSSILSAHGFDVPILRLDLDRDRVLLEIVLFGSEAAVREDRSRLRRFRQAYRFETTEARPRRTEPREPFGSEPGSTGVGAGDLEALREVVIRYYREEGGDHYAPRIEELTRGTVFLADELFPGSPPAIGAWRLEEIDGRTALIRQPPVPTEFPSVMPYLGVYLDREGGEWRVTGKYLLELRLR